MIEPTLRAVNVGGLRMHVAEAGSGPLVLLCHGFPESWYSWRHQLTALAEAGFRVVAPDMRGYGGTDAPEAVDEYTMLHLVGDMIGLLDALGAERAAIAGHDWGAPVAWNAGLLRPDRFRAVIALSTPMRPQPKAPLTTLMPQNETEQFYQLYFQEPGVAEAEFGRDVRRSLRLLLHAASGDRGAPDASAPITMVTRGEGFLDRMAEPERPPAWLSPADLDHYVETFERTGFAGGLNWYRNLDRNRELLATFAGARLQNPALYIAGDRDPVVAMLGRERLLEAMSCCAPHLREPLFLPGCGHWTQQERPEEVNAAMIGFLKSLEP